MIGIEKWILFWVFKNRRNLLRGSDFLYSYECNDPEDILKWIMYWNLFSVGKTCSFTFLRFFTFLFTFFFVCVGWIWCNLFKAISEKGKWITAEIRKRHKLLNVIMQMNLFLLDIKEEQSLEGRMLINHSYWYGLFHNFSLIFCVF